MKSIIKYTLAAATLVISGTVMAQNLESAYFLDGYAYGHQLNPAKEYDRSGFVAFPLLGNLNFGAQGNFGVSSLLFKAPNGGLQTFLHPDLDYKTATSGIHDRNMMQMNLSMEILGFGFHTKHFYNTFDLRLRSESSFMLPGDMLRMMKKLENKDYSFNNLGLRTENWVEAAFGTSRDVIDGVRVGGKFKFLVGAAYANLKMNNMRLDLSDTDKWIINADATAEVGIKGFTWGETKTKEHNDTYMNDHPGADRTYEEIDFDNIDVKSPGLGGLGAAFDLGAEADLGRFTSAKGLKVGLALLDLGFIRWNNVSTAKTSGTATFDGFNDIEIKDGGGNDIEDLADDLGDRFEELFSLRDGGTTAKTRALGATLNVSAEYTMPFYDRLRVGFLSTTRIQGSYTWNEERFAATVSPIKWFEASINLGVGTFGASFGWVLNVHPRGFNLFLGMDHVMGKLAKQGVPLKSNADITLGINIPFGKSRVK